ncbi:MAG: L-seryl-tRNA(Sec) selenium transferase [Conexibacter sp.]
MTDDAQVRARLRALPAVDRLAAQLANGVLPTPAEAVSVARAVLAERREELLAGASADGEPDLASRARGRLQPGPRRVLNGTGIVIHTNLGRAPLALAAARALADAAHGYADLELDLEDGRRGHRDQHARDLLRELTGAEDGMAVNNAAGAALLAVAALAGGERPAIVSRGQLVEIGGGFRVPEVIAQAGARLVEVGTTNRTRLADYERALASDPDALVLRVHQSNFRTVGFVEEVEIEELCGLGAPVIDDVGSGALTELPALADEPSVRRSVQAGAALTCFSGDKLLGGPQAGILVGRAEAVEACRRHPLARALRIGRLPLAALVATLALHRDPERARRAIPVLAMLDVDRAVLEARAARLSDATGCEVVEAVARVGGGALPLLELHGPAVALTAPGGDDTGRLAAALRTGDPPLIARIADGRLLVDPRTLTDDEIGHAATAIRTALART